MILSNFHVFNATHTTRQIPNNTPAKQSKIVDVTMPDQTDFALDAPSSRVSTAFLSPENKQPKIINATTNSIIANPLVVLKGRATHHLQTWQT